MSISCYQADFEVIDLRNKMLSNGITKQVRHSIIGMLEDINGKEGAFKFLQKSGIVKFQTLNCGCGCDFADVIVSLK
jgi:hypothetical protein